MKKNKIVIVILLVVVLLALGVWIGIVVSGSNAANPSAPSGYTAVYLTSGDIYFGKLHWFPKPYLSDALFVTRNTGANGQPQIGIASFASSFWAPVGDLYFNPAQVLFTAPLRNDSQIIQAIENPASLSAGTSPSAPATSAASPSPATSTGK